MRAITAALGTAAAIWIGTAFWAGQWIEKQPMIGRPDATMLWVADHVWHYSPAVDGRDKVEMALKLSWLRALSAANRKHETVDGFIDSLIAEVKSIDDYVSRNERTIHPKMRARAGTQVLVYVNRIEIFKPISNRSDLGRLAAAMETIASKADDDTGAAWLREMYLRSAFIGDQARANDYRKRFWETIVRLVPEVPERYHRATLDFYEGTLQCIGGAATERTYALLDRSAQVFAQFKQYTENFLNGDLNVLFLGRGMLGGQPCRDALNRIISASA